MSSKPGSGEHLVFALCVDIDAEVEDGFNHWYSNHHLPKVVACPGVISGRRYVARGLDADTAKYWAFYEVETKQAMNSAAIQPLVDEGFGAFVGNVRNVQRFWFTPVEAGG